MEEIKSLHNNIEMLFGYSEAKPVKKFEVKDNNEDLGSVIDNRDVKQQIEPRELAGSIEQILNTSQKKVKFGVDASGDSSGIKFKIVNQETGEILREFPKEDISKLREVVAKKSDIGVLVDELA